MSGESESNLSRKLDEVTSAVATFSATVYAEQKAQVAKITDLEMVIKKGGEKKLGLEAELVFIQKSIDDIESARAKEKAESDKRDEENRKAFKRAIFGTITAAVLALLAAGLNSYMGIAAQGGTP
jgi:hypothetical protein